MCQIRVWRIIQGVSNSINDEGKDNFLMRTPKLSKNILKVNELEEEKLQGDSNFKNMVKEVDLLRMKIDQWKEYKRKDYNFDYLSNLLNLEL